MRTFKSSISLLLLLLLLVSAVACAKKTDEPDTSLNLRVMVLNGTTGFGMAKLMNDHKNGKAALNYTFTTEASGETVIKALINGSVDIAALPTNAAAKVYQKTNGGVQILALNTLGVLYVVANGEAENVKDLASLRGKTVYCPADNPAIIFTAICTAAGLKVGEDITIDTTYAEPAKLRSAVAAGEVSLAVLPEPMVTIAMKANTALTSPIDLTAEWDKYYTPGSLAQGCIVVRTEFAETHPVEIEAFLQEYAASIAFLTANPKEAAQLIVEEGIFAGNTAIVEAAIPKCNVTFKRGEDARAALLTFYNVLFSIDPTSIGGTVPQDSFYYGVK
jgi:NitT/TauT family transport system substrate-binding protein